jgi:phage baseplate assembly protein V
MNALTQLARKVRLMLGLGIVTMSDDAKRIQQLQVTLLTDEVRDRANRYQDYGFTSRPLSGAECITAAIGGSRSHTVVIRCDDGRYRKQGLEPGEVAIYTDEGDLILLKRGREIQVQAGTKVVVIAPEVLVQASTKVEIDAPLCELSGDLTVAGTIEGQVVMTADGVDLGTHQHQHGDPITGAPV